jgi:hypothetical protein
VEKRRRWVAESNTDERYKENDLTRSLPLSKTLILDQAVVDQLPQLILRGAQSRLDLLRGPHGNEFLVLDHLEHLLLIH